MSPLDVPFRSRAFPQIAVLSLIAIAAAGCSDSARFSSRQSPPHDVTGSVANRPVSRVQAQPLPAPSHPATTAAYGGQQAYYRPAPRAPEVTGSVMAKPATGHWTWDGGAPVTVGQGETVEMIARRHGVPVSAILETNGFTSEAVVKPGQRLVIPRYVSGEAPAAIPRAASEGVHVVAPGETLMALSRKYGVSVSTIARANNIQPYAALNIGDRLVIPGERHVAAVHTPAPQIAAPRTIKPLESVGSVPPENARIATPEPVTAENPAKTAEAAGNLPTFRWPAKGRVLAGFGQKINGVPNDGINVSLPEGTPVKAAEDGVVAYAGNELKGYGNLVLLRHANGYVSAYANASELMVKKGDTVKRGQVVAHSGQTGNVSSPQLHFEIRKGSTPVDPMQFLNGA